MRVWDLFRRELEVLKNYKLDSNQFNYFFNEKLKFMKEIRNHLTS